jgi:hypothetical protein
MATALASQDGAPPARMMVRSMPAGSVHSRDERIGSGRELTMMIGKQIGLLTEGLEGWRRVRMGR